MQRKKILSIIFLSGLLVSSCNKPEVAVNTSKADPNGIQVIKESVVAKEALQLPNFATLVKQVGSTVVNITAETPVQTNIADMDPFFDLFRQFGQQIPRQKPQTQIKTSMGSGFIISKDGYILTNSHVVYGAKKITVKTTDRRELQAKLVGQDNKTDIALLKVIANDLNPVRIGDPDKLDVGEWVAAIGAPFGFDNSVTQGIVSAKGRNIASDTIVPFIQSDVPINPGNSGGPLFNLNGEVVGINSQIYSRSGGYMGISFSIPIDIAINIANQLKQFGKVLHGVLGVQVQAVTVPLAQSFGLKSPNGAIIAQVIPNSAAAKAGLKTGDVILQVDGKDVTDSSSLPLMIGSKHPGDIVILLVFRNKQSITIKATLDSAPDGIGEAKNDNNQGNDHTLADTLKVDKFGMTVKNLQEEQRRQLGAANGVVITEVGSIAQMAGLLPGDVILSVENKEISNVNQLKNILHDKNMVALLVLRNNQRMYITISAAQ